jgi:HEAT repeat protein
MRIRRQKLLLTLLLAVIVVGPLVVYLIWPREPSYQGKTLSAWIEPFCRETPTGIFTPGGPQYFEQLQPTRRAVAQIGTNAVPFLIARLEYRESTVKRTMRRLLEKQPISAFKMSDPRCSRIRGIRALAVLGPAAQPAVPALAAQLKTDPTLADHLIYALSGIGPEGMRALVNQYTNAGPSVRMQIATVLMSPSSTYRGENVSRLAVEQIPCDIMVEGLSRVALDPLKHFQIPAIQQLMLIGPAASNAVPVLLKIVEEPNSLRRQMAIHALGQIKARPDLVVPALTNLLDSGDMRTQIAARSALRAFGYDVPPHPNMQNQFPPRSRP